VAAFPFRDIEELEVLRRFQDDLYAIAGIPFVLTRMPGVDSERLARFAKWNPLCRLVRASLAGNAACEVCDKEAYANCLQSRRPAIYECHLGLQDVVVPLLMQGEIIGLMCSGQFLLSPPSEKGFAQMKPKLASLEVDLLRARRFYFRTPVIPRNKANAIIHMVLLVSEYVTEAERTMMDMRHVSQRDPIRRAEDFLERRYAEPMRLKDVAAAVGLSASRLAHLMREQLNTTFTQYRNQVRIERAKFLLTNSHLKVIDIGYDVGFGSPSTFNDAFRRLVGCAPTAYRRQQSAERPET
jgi:AraC-like DNA-binding protein